MLDAREEGFVVDKQRTDERQVRRSQRVLTVEDVEAIRAERMQTGTLEVQATETALPRPSASGSADPAAALRYARIGILAVAVLVFMLVWIRQRRKG